MKQWVLFFAICLASVRLASAGTITGTVRAEGKAEVSGDAGGGKYDSRQFKFAEKVNYEEMHDFVVYVVGKFPGEETESNKTAVVETHRVTQKGAMFSPHVLPIVTGTTVEWPNNDDILHNVFSFSETKSFDLGLYKSPAKSVVFDTEGRVDVFCSIHSRMNCIVLVLENRHFASSNSKGGYVIPKVPAGHYKLKAWHERLPSLVKEIDVPETGEIKVDFVLGIKNLPAL